MMDVIIGYDWPSKELTSAASTSQLPPPPSTLQKTHDYPPASQLLPTYSGLPPPLSQLQPKELVLDIYTKNENGQYKYTQIQELILTEVCKALDIQPDTVIFDKFLNLLQSIINKENFKTEDSLRDNMEGMIYYEEWSSLKPTHVGRRVLNLELEYFQLFPVSLSPSTEQLLQVYPLSEYEKLKYKDMVSLLFSNLVNKNKKLNNKTNLDIFLLKLQDEINRSKITNENDLLLIIDIFIKNTSWAELEDNKFIPTDTDGLTALNKYFKYKQKYLKLKKLGFHN